MHTTTMASGSEYALRRWGLVIQGPLVSHGKAGRSAHIPEQYVTEEGLNRVDCRPIIRQNIRESAGLFDQVVVTTWETELRDDDGWEGITLVATEDPGGIPDRDWYKSDSRRRQSIGIIRGLEALEASITHVVRIRTDQVVPLQELVSSYIRISEGREGIIGVPYVHPESFLVADFYFAGPKYTLEDIFNSSIAYDHFEFSPNIHRDLLLKYAYEKHRKHIGVPGWAYFPETLASRTAHSSTRRIYEHLFSREFSSLSRNTLAKTSWRGSVFSTPYINACFKQEKLRPIDLSLRSVPALVSIDWRRYYAFMRVTGQPVSSAQVRVHILLGEVGRKVLFAAWRLMRRMQHFMYRLSEKAGSR